MTSRLRLLVPPHSLRWYAEGSHCTNPNDGDILLVRHLTDVATGISIGEKILSRTTQKELKGYTWLDHTAIIRRNLVGHSMVSEMGPRGWELRSLEEYRDRLYCVVDVEMEDVQRNALLKVDSACHGATYGWWQYVPIVLDGLTGAKLNATWGDTMICSTHVSYCLMAGGFFPAIQPESVIPAHLALWFGAKDPRCFTAQIRSA